MDLSQREDTRYHEGTKPEGRSWLSPMHAHTPLGNPRAREADADFRLTELVR